MKKALTILGATALLAGAMAFAAPKPIEVLAEGPEPETSSAIVSSEEPIVSSESSSTESAVSSESSVAPEPEFQYRIKPAAIQYRDSEVASYSMGDSKIGNYFLSADGWNEEAEPITMTIKGNVTTKLESKIVYIYEYKPTTVLWNGAEIKPNSEKIYELAKPAEPGDYDLTIYFTKEIITNPMDLTSINWASFFTVQNLMTVLAWVVILAGIITLYFVNAHYKKKGSTTLDDVKKYVNGVVADQCGQGVASSVSKALERIIGVGLENIDAKLAKVDNNNATLVRCLLLMQEDTPQARLAIIECLSKLDVSQDGKANEVAQMIKAEMDKYKAEQEAREKALEEAKKANEEWKATVDEKPEPVAEPEPSDEPTEGDYGKL